VSQRWVEPGTRGFEGNEIFHHNVPIARELRDLVAQSKSPDAVAQAQALAKRKAIEAAENKLRTANVPGFFPTPPALCQQMIEAADLPDTPSEDFSILEPSAGIGSLIDAILIAVPEMAGRIDAFEVAYSCSEVLIAKEHNHARGDFLWAVPQADTYDRILMNPPFENNADIEHVQHAYKWLKPGGRLVAIMSEGSFNASASRQKVAAFQYWLNDIGAESTPIRDAFKDATAFRNTGVAVRLVVIDKPE
jgi:predicted RNA methylase